jgi:hypothetical protein
VTARRLVAILLAAATLVAAPAATAKHFDPGDLLICNAKRCRSITSRAVLKVLSVFYYTGRNAPAVASRARLGAPAFELRFTNDYVAGIVATAKLDRFLSYGVHHGWFQPGRWHRVPERAARELRRLTAHLKPLRVTQGSLAKSS